MTGKERKRQRQKKKEKEFYTCKARIAQLVKYKVKKMLQIASGDHF
jgi:hypothetical protein